jgi:polysaccharide export outer membrane protein
MNFYRSAAIVFLSAWLLSACSIQKQIPFYLQQAPDSTIVSSNVVVPELKIQPNDLLSIEISSKSTQPDKSDQIFNQVVMAGGGQGANNPTFGYLVDKEGNIEHHRLGKIPAAGRTRFELAEEIRKRILSPVELLTDPTVKVRFINFRVNVLGMVAREGSVTVNTERLTILEAIALAGGITDFGRRDYVRVIREQEGQRTVGTLDLTKADFYGSPYYHLSQNDVVLVEPTSMRYRDLEQNRINQRIGFILPIVTLAITLINFLTR